MDTMNEQTIVTETETVSAPIVAKTKGKTNKVALYITMGIFAVALIVGGILLGTVESRVTGQWLAGPADVEELGVPCYSVLFLEEDGTYDDLYISLYGQELLDAKTGFWEVSKFEVLISDPEQYGVWRVFDYNPFNNTISNKKWTYESVK